MDCPTYTREFKETSPPTFNVELFGIIIPPLTVKPEEITIPFEPLDKLPADATLILVALIAPLTSNE